MLQRSIFKDWVINFVPIFKHAFYISRVIFCYPACPLPSTGWKMPKQGQSCSSSHSACNKHFETNRLEKPTKEITKESGQQSRPRKSIWFRKSFAQSKSKQSGQQSRSRNDKAIRSAKLTKKEKLDSMVRVRVWWLGLFPHPPLNYFAFLPKWRLS